MEVKDLYDKNDKTLLEEVRDDANRWKKKKHLCSRIENISIIRTAKLPKDIYQFIAISIKLPESVLTKLKNNYFKIYMEPKWAWIAKAILNKKNKAGGITLPHFKPHSLEGYGNQSSMVLEQTYSQTNATKQKAQK